MSITDQAAALHAPGRKLAIGTAEVQGARLAGAGTIIAIGLSDGKLALGRRLGATQCASMTGRTTRSLQAAQQRPDPGVPRRCGAPR